MFIELTDDENGKLTLINVDDIRSVYESNSNKDNAVIYFRSGDPAVTTTESYAEVVTMVRNATEPAEVNQEISGYFDINKLPWDQDDNIRI